MGPTYRISIKHSVREYSYHWSRRLPLYKPGLYHIQSSMTMWSFLFNGGGVSITWKCWSNQSGAPFVKLKWLKMWVFIVTVHYQPLGLASQFSKSPSDIHVLQNCQSTSDQREKICQIFYPKLGHVFLFLKVLFVLESLLLFLFGEHLFFCSSTAFS